MKRNNWIITATGILAITGALCASVLADSEFELNTTPYSAPLGDSDEVGGEFVAASSLYTQSQLTTLGYTTQTSGLAGTVSGVTLSNLDGAGTFETFCLQETVNVDTNTWYSYSEGNNIGGNSATPLSKGAAWLYYEFATGALANASALGLGGFSSAYNYNYSTSGGGRLISSEELQNAIWALQGEAYYEDNDGYATAGADPFVILAEDEFGSLANAMAANGIGGNSVGVAVLVNGSDPVQNQLILAPGGGGMGSVPDGGATVCLLGLALAGLAFARRKFVSI